MARFVGMRDTVESPECRGGLVVFGGFLKEMAMSIVRKACILAVAMVPAAWSLAQDAGKPAAAEPAKAAQPDANGAAKAEERRVEPAAEKMLEEAKAALKKTRDISFGLTQTSPMGESKGTLTLVLPEKPGMGFPLSVYRIGMVGEGGKPTKEWSSDGKKMWLVDHGAKKVLSMEIGAGTMPPEDVWPILPQWVFESMFENPMLKTVSATLEGESEVGGVKCRVVKQVQEMEIPGEEEGEKPMMMTMTTTRHLGADMLPRKIESSMKMPGMEALGGEMKTVSEMKDLKANAGLKAEDMAAKTPEGYAEEKGTYESMGIQNPEESAPKLKAEVGQPALAFKLNDSKGKEVTLESLKGRVVLLDFWATWCGPCKAAMPAIQKLHEKYADKPVTIIGVNCWEQKDDAAVKYMEKQKFTYTLLLKGDDLAKEYGITGIPTLILIDKEGKVLHTAVGFGPGEEEHLAELIDKELAKK